MKRVTKKSMIEKHLIDRGSITPLEAVVEYWAMRLSGTIYELKAAGWVFNTTLVKHKSGSHFAKYELISLPQDYYDD